MLVSPDSHANNLFNIIYIMRIKTCKNTALMDRELITFLIFDSHVRLYAAPKLTASHHSQRPEITSLEPSLVRVLDE